LKEPFIQHLQEGGVLKALGKSFVKPGYGFQNDLIGLHLKDRGFQIMVHRLPEWRKIEDPNQEPMRIIVSA
jgi:hypothetical protein